MSSSLELLLAGATDLRPVLAEGLPLEAAGAAPWDPRALGCVDALTLEAPDVDPNDLPAQRWGVVAPEGRDGDVALEAIASLIELREREQGAPARRYRVPADMDLYAAWQWKRSTLRAESIPQAERPRYLLVLGDLHQVSAELQHVLANGSFVGRLHFADERGDLDAPRYRQYADKVARWTGAPAGDEKADALFFAAGDATPATRMERRLLVEPCLAMAATEGAPLLARAPVDAGNSASSLLAAAAGGRPSVLLTVSHGLGRRGATAAEIRRRQGALLLGAGEVLSAESLGAAPFLPGGFWFCVACYGAGTPRASAFHPWLSVLAREGLYAGRLQAVLDALPGPGERPFLAALPQAVLAKPDGPLAVVAHLDLAWAYAFADDRTVPQSRASRILGTLLAAARGSRAGAALGALHHAYREVNDELAGGYQAEEEARVWGRPNPIAPLARANAFMLRNDLRGYVLLGDPAVRLPLKAAVAAVGRAPSEGAAAPAVEAGPDVARMEEAVLDVLRGAESPRAIAKRHRITPEQLAHWERAYKEAGRERLAKLR